MGLTERNKKGVMPHEIGVFVRSEAELDRAREAVTKSGLPFKVLDERVETTSGQASIQHHAPSQRFGVPGGGGDGL